MATVGVAVVGPGTAAARSATVVVAKPAAPSIATLRRDVAATADRLAAATVAWEKGQTTLGSLVMRKMLSRQAAEQLERDAAQAQVRVSSLAAAMYRSPVDPMITAFLTGNAQAIGDVVWIQRTMGQTNTAHQEDLKVLRGQSEQARLLLEREDDAAKRAIMLQRELDDQLDALQRDAAASVLRLERALDALRRQAQAAAAARRSQLQAASGGLLTGGPPCSADAPVDAINGFLPAASLCGLSSAPGHRLSRAAAAAFDAMSAAYRARFGTPICVTDSYRDYAGQVSVFQRKPSLAAVPGRSQHGWGRALDLCGGVQTFGSQPHQWLKANAAAFSFTHPSWAEPNGSRPEAWHWEFIG